MPFIRPSAQTRSAIVELFPEGSFTRDASVLAASLGHGYAAVQGARYVPAFPAFRPLVGH
jgi:hypothetical protein